MIPRRSSLLRRSRLRAVSPKRAAQKRQYGKLKGPFLARNPVCQFPECGKQAVDLHHKAGRRGAKLLDIEHFAALCRPHHEYVTVNPAEAFRLGLSESRLA